MEHVWFVDYESKKHTIDSKSSGSFSVRIIVVERTMMRSPSGRHEIICQQKPLYDEETKREAAIEFVARIPSIFLCSEEICRDYVTNVFTDCCVHSLLKDSVVPKICKDMITMSRLLAKQGKRGFLVEANVQLVIQIFGNHNEDSQGHRRIQTEQEDCIICLEELSSSSTSEDGQRRILTLPCSHSFHRNCVIRWLRNKHLCPTCRDDIQDPRPMN